MKKVLLLIIGIVLLAGGLILIIKSRTGSGNVQSAMLRIDSTPQSTVFLDGQNAGQTPYENKLAPGEHTVRLVPETALTQAVSWEGKVKLTANLLTYISRELGISDGLSAGEILTLDKSSGNNSEIVVVSMPDSAGVSLGGENKGVTPLALQDISPGNYELKVSKSGYLDRTVKIKTTAGYKLTAFFQLALSTEVPVLPSPSASVSASLKPVASIKPSPSTLPSSTPKSSPKASVSASPKSSPVAAVPPAKPYIEILETPTNYLNVRKEPSTAAEIISRVNPGEYYSLLDEDTGGKWYKIEYETGKEGWVSSQYAKKFE